MNRVRDIHNARLGEQCVYLQKNADLVLRRVYFYFKFMVVLEIDDIK